MRAILPAGGKGTRMARFTKGGSKEMLPLAGKPVIEWAAQEALDAGLGPIVVVAGPGKHDLLAWAAGFGCEVALQPEPLGLADAVRCGMAPGQPCAVLLPDTLIHPRSPLAEMTRLIMLGADICLAASEVEESKISRYGILDLAPEQGVLAGAVEKPSPADAPSRLAITARYAFSARVAAQFLAEQQMGGDVSVTPYLDQMIRAGFAGRWTLVPPGSRRLDCGSPVGYEEAVKALS